MPEHGQQLRRPRPLPATTTARCCSAPIRRSTSSRAARPTPRTTPTPVRATPSPTRAGVRHRSDDRPVHGPVQLPGGPADHGPQRPAPTPRRRSSSSPTGPERRRSSTARAPTCSSVMWSRASTCSRPSSASTRRTRLRPRRRTRAATSPSPSRDRRDLSRRLQRAGRGRRLGRTRSVRRRRRGCRCRQRGSVNRNVDPPPWRGVDPDRPAEGLDRLPGDVQAEADALLADG